MEYLQKLIEINNQYRATPWTLEDWIKIYYKGQWDFWRAGKLIEKLQQENSQKRSFFSEKIADRVDRQHQETIFASDFSAYGFCPNSFYLSYRGYASKNLYELNQGNYYHGEYASDREGYINQNNRLLKKKINRRIEEIKWFKLDDSDVIYDKKINIAGVPDGMIMFDDKTISIVEIKSRKYSQRDKPYIGDIMQACAYLHICKGSGKVDPSRMNSKMFIINIDKESKERQLFEVDFDQYKRGFYLSLKKMKNITFQKELYYSDRNKKKCSSCGYRVLCKKMSESNFVKYK